MIDEFEENQEAFNCLDECLDDAGDSSSVTKTLNKHNHNCKNCGESLTDNSMDDTITCKKCGCVDGVAILWDAEWRHMDDGKQTARSCPSREQRDQKAHGIANYQSGSKKAFITQGLRIIAPGHQFRAEQEVGKVITDVCGTLGLPQNIIDNATKLCLDTLYPLPEILYKNRSECKYSHQLENNFEYMQFYEKPDSKLEMLVFESIPAVAISAVYRQSIGVIEASKFDRMSDDGFLFVNDYLLIGDYWIPNKKFNTHTTVRRNRRYGLYAACIYWCCKEEEATKDKNMIVEAFQKHGMNIKASNICAGLNRELVGIESRDSTPLDFVEPFCRKIGAISMGSTAYSESVKNILLEIEKYRLDELLCHAPKSHCAGTMYYVAMHLPRYASYAENNALLIQQATNVSWATINKWYRHMIDLRDNRGKSHTTWFRRILSRAK